ncbi:unnamed protein product [Amoebophrya sp. A120]|nr:unnamed protein product [Amoebophrya sp. A120]|eukprot:GSA120T00006844001.1
MRSAPPTYRSRTTSAVAYYLHAMYNASDDKKQRTLEATSATSSTWQEQNQEQDPRFLEVAPGRATLTSTATAATHFRGQIFQIGQKPCTWNLATTLWCMCTVSKVANLQQNLQRAQKNRVHRI